MIYLDYRDARPIHQQVRDGLRQLIVAGAITPGEKLPSVRSLASQLAINPNTIQRAYEELEAEGYTYTLAGKGSFAAPVSDVNEKRREAVLIRFDQAAEELIHLGLTAEELAVRLPREKKG